MSEFHPNRTKQIRTRPKLTARKVFECWPLLVWAGVLFIAYYLYSGGVQFTRMNGAVDPYTETVAPVEEGRLAKILVERGQRVAPGAPVAQMDDSTFVLEIESMKREFAAGRIDDVRDLDLEIIKLESDMREIQIAEAEDAAVIKELDKVVSDVAKAQPNPQFPNLQFFNSDLIRARTDLSKATARQALSTQHKGKVEEILKRIQGDCARLEKESADIGSFDPQSDDLSKIATSLRDNEHAELIGLKTQIELCQLRTNHGGIVDRIEKEIGEFITKGESILKVVGDPVHIVAFLPQDQADDLKDGQPVFVVSTADKTSLYETTVLRVAPRINNLPDSTSPLPNRRVHGRDVLVKYPDSAKTSDGKFKLLPGQTVIIHTEKPGEINLLDSIFQNDDNDKVR